MDNNSNKMKKTVASIVATILCLCCVGCTFDEGMDSFGKALGLDMNGDDGKVTAQIEYLDREVTPEVAPAVTEEVTDEKPVEEPEPEATETINDIANKTYTKTAANPDCVTISFAGDVCLTEGCSVLNYIKRNNNDMSKSFDESLLNRMVSSDIFMLNNEFPYSYGGVKNENKMYTFRADPADAVLLEGIGTDIVSLANNHIYDYGPDALCDTITTLNDINMPHVGAGENINEAIKPAYFMMNGKTISIIAATQIEGYANPETKEATEDSPGVFRCLDTTRIKEQIEEAKTKSDFCICFIHWGTERSDLIRDWQRQEAKDMVEAGADLIVGAHSHCLQGIDYVDGVPVCYSMGNYLFNSNTQDTCLITATLDTSNPDSVNIKSLQFVPCIQSGGMTKEVTDGGEMARIIAYEQGISNHANIDAEGYITYSETDRNTQNGVNTSPMRREEEITPAPGKQ